MKKISILLITLGCLLGLNMSLSAQSTGTENGHEWVDLGLPSGLKWATCNVGASSPEKSGNYYAWGETKPKDEYNNGLTYDKQMDDISGNAQYDAATANWGGDWRMPTKEEMEELVNNCICEMIRQNGARGYKLTGPNGNSIFLPEGARYNRELVMCKSVFYWTSTPTSSLKSSVYLSISDTGERIVGTIDNLVYNRSSGLHIRPVKSRVGIETPIVTASVVEFTDITAIIKTYATDGGAELTERGFYWGTNPNPSETDNKVVIENTVGNKINALLNLTPNTTYYVKAYATNSEGTSYSEVVSFTTLEEIVHEYVDLGLPSGLKWATCNVGANSPEEYGNYYACGEVVTKTEYSSSNCPTYGLTTSQLQAQGYIDGEGNLTAQYDAATANWGGNWRMPTKAEMQELIGNCTWEWTTQNGKNGCKVTGPNGNYIFLPAAGRRDGSSLFNVGSIGSFWSSTPDGSGGKGAYYLYFDSDGHYMYNYSRYDGQSVRPVKSRVGIETPCVTASVVEFTDITAIIKTYASDGGAEFTERGLYYGTNPNPSETDNKVVLENEVGLITNVLIDLTPNTTYYVKAYATNETGTSYSEVMTFTTLENPKEYEYVDLGLPSGLKWATCNIGANSPEEYGNYYAWGEVLPKDTYTEANSLTYGKEIEDISGNAQYDAATVNWGGNWRLPTKAEMQELIDNCTWEWTTQNGVKGYKVTSKHNSNYIFLPDAGYRKGSSLHFAGTFGHYWSSTPNVDYRYAYDLYLMSENRYLQDYYRYYGLSVRPVLE